MNHQDIFYYGCGLLAFSFVAHHAFKTYTARQSKRKLVERIVESNKSCVSLHSGEVGTLAYVDSISTVTFYHGNYPAKYLKEKVSDIIRQNLWLCSRLVRTSGGTTIAVHPCDISAVDIDQYFILTSDSELNVYSPYDETNPRIVGKHTIKTGNECINVDEPLFRVTLIKCSEPENFCVVFSLGHMLGDGHTYYKIYSMLDVNTPAYALQPKRIEGFREACISLQGPSVLNYFESPWFIIGLLSTGAFGSVPKCGVYRVNEDWINAQKHAASAGYGSNNVREKLRSGSNHTPSIPFISTNDILTSWFGRQCGSDFCMMAVNIRNRVKEYTDSDAGNYETMMLYGQSDIDKPEYIRSSLSTYKSKSQRVPTVLQAVKNHICIITNWSSFYHDIQFENCKQDMHVPLLPLNSILCKDIGVIFRPRKKELALLIITRSIGDKTLSCNDEALLERMC